MAGPHVLILCTGNSARSQMAEGLLRQKAEGAFEVLSAGTDPASQVNPLAVEAMREIGIDISSHRPKDLGEFLGRAPIFHLIIVCHDADKKCPTIWPGVASREHWPIEDPAALDGDKAARVAKFSEVRDELSHRLDLWLAKHRAPVR